MEPCATKISTARLVFVFAAWVFFYSNALAQTNLGPNFTNSLGMEFVRVEPGSFLMGTARDTRTAEDRPLAYDEQPHWVTLTQPFYILQRRVSSVHFQHSGLPGDPNDVSWNDAAAFCRWLTQQER